jgi:hypothetical protein
MDALLIVGASGHAKVVADIVQRQGLWRVAGFIDAALPAGAEHFGLPVLGAEADLPEAARTHGARALLVAIGDNAVRARVVARVAALAPELAFATAVHPAASVARAPKSARAASAGPGPCSGPTRASAATASSTPAPAWTTTACWKTSPAWAPGRPWAATGAWAPSPISAWAHRCSTGGPWANTRCSAPGPWPWPTCPRAHRGLRRPGRPVRLREPGERYY